MRAYMTPLTLSHFSFTVRDREVIVKKVHPTGIFKSYGLLRDRRVPRLLKMLDAPVFNISDILGFCKSS